MNQCRAALIDMPFSDIGIQQLHADILKGEALAILTMYFCRLDVLWGAATLH